MTDEDVRKVAAALLKTAIETVSEEDGGAANKCKLCGASVSWQHPVEDIVHAPDCPVTIAQHVVATAKVQVLRP
ncbi:DUF3222 domain-containing protein [Rhodoplanes roseus]|uniref:DUF3222 domain-containing protein n=1 Tax=Rhodoplanes roseus TaxID=29409 RepID=A0A327L006_9BRAD|nr:DUF3222 domain-containing protein [Rhodoplanes roseus]